MQFTIIPQRAMQVRTLFVGLLFFIAIGLYAWIAYEALSNRDYRLSQAANSIAEKIAENDDLKQEIVGNVDEAVARSPALLAAGAKVDAFSSQLDSLSADNDDFESRIQSLQNDVAAIRLLMAQPEVSEVSTTPADLVERMNNLELILGSIPDFSVLESRLTRVQETNRYLCNRLRNLSVRPQHLETVAQFGDEKVIISSARLIAQLGGWSGNKLRVLNFFGERGEPLHLFPDGADLWIAIGETHEVMVKGQRYEIALSSRLTVVGAEDVAVIGVSRLPAPNVECTP